MTDEHRSASPSQSISLIFLRHAHWAPVVTNQKPFISDIERLARQFFDFLPTEQLKYFTKFVDDELVRIDPAAWPSIYHFVTSIWIETGSGPSAVNPQEVNSSSPWPPRYPQPRTSNPWAMYQQRSRFATPTGDGAPQFIFLRRENRVPLVTSQKSSISDIEQIARQFFSFSPYEQLKLFTKFDDDELVRVDPAAWPSIYHVISSIWIETAYRPPSVSSREVRPPSRSSRPYSSVDVFPPSRRSSRSSERSVLNPVGSREPSTP
ncbi:hypothetical protein F5887DRAFT_950093 [Amanita rubescens]|nr:hypothetical protein F5887DRAFT_950093 [Amanita rubescens]